MTTAIACAVPACWSLHAGWRAAPRATRRVSPSSCFVGSCSRIPPRAAASDPHKYCALASTNPPQGREESLAWPQVQHFFRHSMCHKACDKASSNPRGLHSPLPCAPRSEELRRCRYVAVTQLGQFRAPCFGNFATVFGFLAAVQPCNHGPHHEAQGDGARGRAVPMRIPRLLEAVRLDGRRA